jgi:hypothetical protein
VSTGLCLLVGFGAGAVAVRGGQLSGELLAGDRTVLLIIHRTDDLAVVDEVITLSAGRVRAPAGELVPVASSGVS